MQTLKSAAVVFCTACICAELLARLTGNSWARRCIKAVAGLYILVVLLQVIPQAGVPPDGFSATGQLWGNPLYRWEVHRNTGYQWWITRMWYCFELYDVVRIDHFRGFDEYFSIPYGSETAASGHWEKGPGIELFRAVEQALGKREIIAEDLGYMSDTVRKLVRDYLYDYATPEEQLYKSMIALVLRSAAATCIIPMQDWTIPPASTNLLRLVKTGARERSSTD